MPQTRFVLRHAIDTGLKIMIVINKIDRPGAEPERAFNDCLDLMADLGASDDQLEFAMEHVVYASGVNGYARLDPEDGNMDMYPLLDMIVDELPAPDVDVDGPLAMQCVTIDHSNFVGRIGIGRVFSGTIHQGDSILVVKNGGGARWRRSSSSSRLTIWVAPSARRLARRYRRRGGRRLHRHRRRLHRPREPRRVRSHPRSIRRPFPSFSRLLRLRWSDAMATSSARASSRSVCSPRARTT